MRELIIEHKEFEFGDEIAGFLTYTEPVIGEDVMVKRKAYSAWGWPAKISKIEQQDKILWEFSVVTLKPEVVSLTTACTATGTSGAQVCTQL